MRDDCLPANGPRGRTRGGQTGEATAATGATIFAGAETLWPESSP